MDFLLKNTIGHAVFMFVCSCQVRSNS